jgi:hypothetical protein
MLIEKTSEHVTRPQNKTKTTEETTYLQANNNSRFLEFIFFHGKSTAFTNSSKFMDDEPLGPAASSANFLHSSYFNISYLANLSKFMNDESIRPVASRANFFPIHGLALYFLTFSFFASINSLASLSTFSLLTLL